MSSADADVVRISTGTWVRSGSDLITSSTCRPSYFGRLRSSRIRSTPGALACAPGGRGSPAPPAVARHVQRVADLVVLEGLARHQLIAVGRPRRAGHRLAGGGQSCGDPFGAGCGACGTRCGGIRWPRRVPLFRDRRGSRPGRGAQCRSAVAGRHGNCSPANPDYGPMVQSPPTCAALAGAAAYAGSAARREGLDLSGLTQRSGPAAGAVPAARVLRLLLRLLSRFDEYQFRVRGFLADRSRGAVLRRAVPPAGGIGVGEFKHHEPVRRPRALQYLHGAAAYDVAAAI